jgi:transcriptional regulator with XRE-family HTH domain
MESLADPADPDDLEQVLAHHLRTLRLRLNLDQRELAARSGVALGVVKRLESGRGATLKSLIKVLRTLGRADWIHSLAPEVTISPLQMLQTKRPRQRASKRRSRGHA